MKFSAKNCLICAVVAIVLYMCVWPRVSRYVASHPISVTAKTDKSLFDLPYELDCVPGSAKEGESTHTRSLTPGGVCGIQQVVSDHASYTIN